LNALRAGCSKVDITPHIGTTMDGYAARTLPSEGIHDRLYCRAIVLDDGAHSVALLSCDVCWFTQETVQTVKSGASSYGLNQVFLSATHNHSGPAMADFLATPTRSGTDYVRSLPASIGAAINKAKGSLQPATLTMGRGRASISSNRRKESGETDPEVLTLILRDARDKPMAGVLNYGCHPTVLGQDNRLISSDFPGRSMQAIENHFGDGFVCLFLNGALGDVNPRTCLRYDCRGTFDDVSKVGQELASASVENSEFIELGGGTEIRLASLEVGPLPPYDLRFAIDLLKLGDLAILGIPGEVFASTGLWLKGHSSTPSLMIASCTNGYFGYFPTDDAFERKDYETRWVCWVSVGAERAVRDAAVALMDELGRK
jgi:neutral ceramidase